LQRFHGGGHNLRPLDSLEEIKGCVGNGGAALHEEEEVMGLELEYQTDGGGSALGSLSLSIRLWWLWTVVVVLEVVAAAATSVVVGGGGGVRRWSGSGLGFFKIVFKSLFQETSRTSHHTCVDRV
jgi:hypothetical protein